MLQPDSLFSDRMADVPKSFIREILKTTVSPEVISFAGGLPNRELFPIQEVRQAAVGVLDAYGAEALQYATSEGLYELRQWISQRYRSQQQLDIHPDNIIITTGSQQGLDLIAKILINEGDSLGLEEPGYLGAIQAFALYRPSFRPVPLHFDGLDVQALARSLDRFQPKLFYTVPSFQNPSGISHSNANRDAVAEVFRNSCTLLIEDNPYGEIRFSGEQLRSYAARLPDRTVLLGSFSKIFVPGFRIGWIAAPDRLMEKLTVAKQAADLHTNYFAQRVLLQYLQTSSIDEHITRIRDVYARQKQAMTAAIAREFPASVRCSNPDGGMFLWAVLPDGIPAREVFDAAIKENVAFVPGDPFYVDGRAASTMRLNFSCVDEDGIAEGIARLGTILRTRIGE
ncbi:PLP-dependent aminotransferase family protein [Spirochaeta africana]|uniref:Transcriptional regulator with HTH domain and aminotransferase domain n=1 Tax=Spirochaeta africana (strain ATCC 700263 / DSM 8902 / Z-7692) TaxID=889378 RepID=H9UL85_SPIAZ|nr:PLP-dependent aminotransferase family protein [Spirochaeta africana]AFG38278.1 transcriptional regulator with HTH domain and aminotransferase domain [Spirochaeta africana DSM 8902]